MLKFWLKNLIINKQRNIYKTILMTKIKFKQKNNHLKTQQKHTILDIAILSFGVKIFNLKTALNSGSSQHGKTWRAPVGYFFKK